ncbi:MAG: hypothetical protein ACRDUA_22820, partial [Micromonosporaceae bacterium]
MDASRAALLDETMKKSGLVWITVPGRRPAPVWYVWRGGADPAAYVLTGGGEQPLPGLLGGAGDGEQALSGLRDGAGVGEQSLSGLRGGAGDGEQPRAGLPGGAGEVTVSARSKDTGALLIGWAADVAVVPPDSPEWAAVLPDLQAKRLNPPDGLDAPERWARDSQLVRLT